jgi:hypothetical protein
MNEKIRELAVQCGAWNQVYNNKEFMIDRTFKVEQFAELIIKECASIADTDIRNPAGCGWITKTKGQLINEHFGVKDESTY